MPCGCEAVKANWVALALLNGKGEALKTARLLMAPLPRQLLTIPPKPPSFRCQTKVDGPGDRVHQPRRYNSTRQAHRRSAGPSPGSPRFTRPPQHPLSDARLQLAFQEWLVDMITSSVAPSRKPYGVPVENPERHPQR